MKLQFSVSKMFQVDLPDKNKSVFFLPFQLKSDKKTLSFVYKILFSLIDFYKILFSLIDFLTFLINIDTI